MGFWVVPLVLQRRKPPGIMFGKSWEKQGRKRKLAGDPKPSPQPFFPTKSSLSRARAAAAKGNICASGAAGNAEIFQHIPCPARGERQSSGRLRGLLGPGKAFPGSGGAVPAPKATPQPFLMTSEGFSNRNHPGVLSPGCGTSPKSHGTSVGTRLGVPTLVCPTRRAWICFPNPAGLRRSWNWGSLAPRGAEPGWGDRGAPHAPATSLRGCFLPEGTRN